MNVLISYDLDSCTASISADSTLTELAFAVESAVSHFLGRGVNRFECTRTRQENGNCVLNFKALKKSGSMKFSKVASLGSAVDAGILPKNIPGHENFQMEEGFDKVISEGQHKHGTAIVGRKKEADGSTWTSIVESFDLNPELPISLLTYGLGDMFTGLFALNCRYLKWQVSIKKTQLYIRHSVSCETLKRFLVATQDYNITQKVSALT
jgi:hypothetical protein